MAPPISEDPGSGDARPVAAATECSRYVFESFGLGTLEAECLGSTFQNRTKGEIFGRKIPGLVAAATAVADYHFNGLGE